MSKANEVKEGVQTCTTSGSVNVRPFRVHTLDGYFVFIAFDARSLDPIPSSRLP
jgi:hypothetical protein